MASRARMNARQKLALARRVLAEGTGFRLLPLKYVTPMLGVFWDTQVLDDAVEDYASALLEGLPVRRKAKGRGPTETGGGTR